MEWMKEREAQNPGAGLYSHWMKAIHEKAHRALDQTREGMRKYYDHKATEQPDLKLADQVILNAKNMHTKRPSKRLGAKVYGLFKIIEKRGNRGSNWKSLHGGRYTLSCMYHYYNPIELPSKMKENNHLLNPKTSTAI